MDLGIDFGTTRTVVAAATHGRHAVVTFDTPGGYAEYLPGQVALHDGQLRFGFEARLALRASQGAVRSLKRAASRVSHVDSLPELGADDVPSLELVTRYLRFLHDRIRHHSNLELSPDEPLRAMVAVPANSGARQRYLTLEAFRRAGFEVTGMLNEPTAAAVEYARRHLGILKRNSPKRYLVVYDLGGGTFDTAAVSLEGRRFELLSSAGIPQLGGDDFDEIILELALEQARVPRPPTAVERLALLDVCQEAKETLTPQSRKLLVDLTLVLPDAEPAVLDTSDIYMRCEPLLQQTIDRLQDVFDVLPRFGIDANNARELGAVYLVGGGSAFPPVARMLKSQHRRKVELALQPHAATALGLAVAGDPEAGIFVRESKTLHFGVWREAAGGREQWFDPLIHKDAANGASDVVERRYRPMHAVGQLRYLECSRLTPDGIPAGDITPFGDVYFPYDPALAQLEDFSGVDRHRRLEREGDEIVETYRFDGDGLVAVELENRTRGYRRSYRLGELLASTTKRA